MTLDNKGKDPEEPGFFSCTRPKTGSYTKPLNLPLIMKMSIRNISIYLVVAVAAMACRTQENKSLQKNESMTEQSVAENNNNFAFDIFNAVNTKEEPNVVISPFSISTALAMTYAGAAGETAEQMAQTLHFPEDQNSFHPTFSQWMQQIQQTAGEDKKLQKANSLWPQEDYHFLESYFQILEQFYNTTLYEVDYTGNREAIRQRINQWVMDNTNNQIEELIKPGVLIEDTRLVLVNAIYFLSDWRIAFDEKGTHDNTFFVSPTNKRQVPFMFMKDTLAYFENQQLQMLELEYEGGDFSMVIALPAEGHDIDKLIADMDAAYFSELAGNFSKQELEVYLPSFTMRSSFDLEKTMSTMGMPLAFSNHANFSKMTGKQDLKIDKIIHQAFVDVNEQGTEAAASTAVAIIRKSAMVGEQPTVFRANRPFLYFIKENRHHSILFMGKTGDPSL